MKRASQRAHGVAEHILKKEDGLADSVPQNCRFAAPLNKHQAEIQWCTRGKSWRFVQSSKIDKVVSSPTCLPPQ